MLGAALEASPEVPVALIAVMLPVASEVSKMMLSKLLDAEPVPAIEVKVCVTEFGTVAVEVTVLSCASTAAESAMVRAAEKCMMQGSR